MNDERLSAQLRSAEQPVTPDPAFLDALYQDLAVDLGFRIDGRTRRRRTSDRTAKRRGGAARRYGPLLLAAAFISVGAIAAMVVGSQRDDLRTAVGQAGTTRMAVRPDFPQADMGGLAGFDVDVAHALMDELALDAELRPVPVDQILSGNGPGDWDLAMPSAVLSAEEQGRFAASDPYYLWPVSVLVPVDSDVRAIADLGGRHVCAVAGSSGAAWLARAVSPAVVDPVLPPAAPLVTIAANDGACMAAVVGGAVDAMVTAAWSPADLAARPKLRSIGGPVYLEPRSVIASRGGKDPTALLLAIDQALGTLRADGTLRQLSGNRFGGYDLSAPEVNP